MNNYELGYYNTLEKLGFIGGLVGGAKHLMKKHAPEVYQTAAKHVKGYGQEVGRTLGRFGKGFTEEPLGTYHPGTGAAGPIVGRTIQGVKKMWK